MNITQTTTFPASPAMLNGNTITVTGTTGTELKQKLNDALQAKLDATAALAAAAAAAQAAVNS